MCIVAVPGIALTCMYSAQVELCQVQIKVKAANTAVLESNQYLEKLPDYLKDVEKSLVPLKKWVYIVTGAWIESCTTVDVNAGPPDLTQIKLCVLCLDEEGTPVVHNLGLMLTSMTVSFSCWAGICHGVPELGVDGMNKWQTFPTPFSPSTANWRLAAMHL